MPFVQMHQPKVYVPTPTPILEGSDKLYYVRELRRMQEVTQSLGDCIKELQAYVATL